MATRFETFSRRPVSANRANSVADDRGLPFCDTPEGFKCTGDWINEETIVPHVEKSNEFSLESHRQEKVGFPASFTAAKAATTRGALLAPPRAVEMQPLKLEYDSRIDGRLWLRMDPALNVEVNGADRSAF